MRKFSLAIALALTVLLALTACSAAKDVRETSASVAGDMVTQNFGGGTTGGDNYFATDSGGTAPAPAPAAKPEMYGEVQSAAGNTGTGDLLSQTDPNRKLIRRADLTYETTDFETSISELERLCIQFEGYVQDSWETGASLVYGHRQLRSASYTLRIPKDKYTEFLGTIGSIGNRISKNEATEDITDSYYDTESRLQILTMRRDRLFKLLEETTDGESIVTFERELSDTLYQIESLTGQLKKYDGLVDYATISIKLEEVVKYSELEEPKPEPEAFTDRVSEAFADSAESIGTFFVDLCVFVLGNILYLLLYAAVVAAVVIPLVIRKRKKSRAPSPAPNPPEPPSGQNPQ